MKTEGETTLFDLSAGPLKPPSSDVWPATEHNMINHITCPFKKSLKLYTFISVAIFNDYFLHI